MYYGSFGAQDSMLTFIFKFDLRKGQCQFKLCQIRSDFQIKSFLTKHAYLVQFSLRIPKWHSFFMHTAIRNSKNRVAKSDVITFAFLGGQWGQRSGNFAQAMVRRSQYTLLQDLNSAVRV